VIFWIVVLANCCDFVIIDPSAFTVVLASRTVSGEKLRKIVRYFGLAQKGISFKKPYPASPETYYLHSKMDRNAVYPIKAGILGDALYSGNTAENKSVKVLRGCPVLPGDFFERVVRPEDFYSFLL